MTGVDESKNISSVHHHGNKVIPHEN